MKQTLFYCKYSDTIRQAPENYLIAKKDPSDQQRWICDPDLAANKELATKIFHALFTFEAHYGTGLFVLNTARVKNEPQLAPYQIKKWEELNGRTYKERNKPLCLTMH